MRAADGVELAAEHRSVPGSRGRVVIVHGYAEHKGRYRQLVEELTAARYSCHLFDLRGHGDSGGLRGHISRIEEYRTDLDAFLAEVRALPEDPSPLLLFGHSLGGLIALDFVLHRPGAFAALAVSSPYLAPAFAIPFLKRTLLPLIAPLVPTLRVPTGLDPAWLSHDPLVVGAYMTDPKVFSTVTLGWAVATRKAQEEVFEKAPAITLPLLVQIGDADPIAAPDRTRALFERLGGPSRRLRVYPGLLHEIFNELERAPVVDDLLAWLGEQTTGGSKERR